MKRLVLLKLKVQIKKKVQLLCSIKLDQARKRLETKKISISAEICWSKNGKKSERVKKRAKKALLQ